MAETGEVVDVRISKIGGGVVGYEFINDKPWEDEVLDNLNLEDGGAGHDDGVPEIFVGNDSMANFLLTRDADGRFVDLGSRSGVASNMDGSEQATMGIAVLDADANGHPDLFTTNFASDTNTLHLNLGDGFFEDRTSQYGLAMISLMTGGSATFPRNLWNAYARMITSGPSWSMKSRPLFSPISIRLTH